MDTVIKIIGIVFVLMGILFFLKPAAIKNVFSFFRKGNRIYLAGIIRLALGIVFLLGARECDIRWVIVVFAMLFLMSGILIFMLGVRRLNSIFSWFLKQPAFFLQILALLVIVFGGIIVYSA